MIDKANVIYERWSAGYEVPTVVLGPDTSDDESDSTNRGTNTGGSLQHVDHYGTTVSQYDAQQQQPDADPFARFHPRLVQCVVEIHQRAKSLLLSRNTVQPPTWGATPVIPSPCSPVLPPEVPEFQFPRFSYSQNGLGYNGISSSSQSYSSDIEIQTSTFGSDQGQGMFYSNTMPTVPQWPPSTLMAVSLTSKMAIVDTINFELGALNTNNDQSWMTFF